MAGPKHKKQPDQSRRNRNLVGGALVAAGAGGLSVHRTHHHLGVRHKEIRKLEKALQRTQKFRDLRAKALPEFNPPTFEQLQHKRWERNLERAKTQRPKLGPEEFRRILEDFNGHQEDLAEASRGHHAKARLHGKLNHRTYRMGQLTHQLETARRHLKESRRNYIAGSAANGGMGFIAGVALADRLQKKYLKKKKPKQRPMKKTAHLLVPFLLELNNISDFENGHG